MKKKLLTIFLAIVMALTLTISIGAAETSYQVSSLKWGNDGTALIGIKNKDTNAFLGWTFCIDKEHETGIGVGGYKESEWSESNITNAGKVAWLLTMANVNASGQIDTNKLKTESGELELNQEEAITVYQKAIWYFTDNMQLSGLNTQDRSYKNYKWLIDNAIVLVEPVINLTLVGPQCVVNGKFGPFRVNSSNDVLLTSEPLLDFYYDDDGLVDKENPLLNTNMYLDWDQNNEGNFTITASSVVAIHTGTIFISKTPNKQKLIMAHSSETSKQVTLSGTHCPTTITEPTTTTTTTTTEPATTTTTTTEPITTTTTITEPITTTTTTTEPATTTTTIEPTITTITEPTTTTTIEPITKPPTLPITGESQIYYYIALSLLIIAAFIFGIFFTKIFKY